MGNGPNTSEKLLLHIEGIERIDAEIEELKLERKDLLKAMKNDGFCTKTAQWAIKERKKTPEERREEEAMRQIYRGALGMLDGTPLGDYALKKLSGKKPEEPAPNLDESKAPDAAPAPTKFMPDVDLTRAAQMGREAAQNGQDVLTNPFPGGDPRRAAWDEAWCQELGSDGMDIPEALRPAKKGKPKDEGAAPANEGDEDGDGEEPENPAEDPQAGAAAPEAVDDGAIDEIYPSVRAFVLQEQRASVTLFRKAFTIGYRKAAHLIERLERDGVISAADVSGLRDVLLDKEGNKK